MQQEMQAKAAEVINELSASGQRVDIIHAHDWLSSFAGITLKHGYRIPLITTIHSTEMGRRHGLHDDGQRMIHGYERRLTYEAWRVIVCSRYMADQIKFAFALSEDKIDIIPNGVYTSAFVDSKITPSFRRKFAADYEKIVLYVGRMVPEKGVNVLIGSIPQVLTRIPNAKFVFVGDGYHRSEFMRIAYDLGVAHKCYFTGFLEKDSDVQKLVSLADICVFPSFYEPFGIVALEAMAAGTPVVVSDVGGFSEIVETLYTGIKVPVDDSNALARAISALLSDPGLAKFLRDNALKKVKNVYSWHKIAKKTLEVYQQVTSEYQKSDWNPKPRSSDP